MKRMSMYHRTTLESIAFVLGLMFAGCATSGANGLRSARGAKRDGAPWTIRCMEMQGEQGSAVLHQLADALRQTEGVRPDEVVVQEDANGITRLYYGTYYRKMNPETGRHTEPPLMRSDLELIRTLGVEGGRRLFAAAMPVRMPQPDVGNPAWDLRNVQARYSLQVAVFEPTDEFYEYKQAAADFCAFLREKGYEAYYFHAPASSSVTVGAFGEDAVHQRAAARGGQTVYENQYAPEVQRLQQEELLRYNLLNGAIYRVRNETGLSEPVPSRLVEIPVDGNVGTERPTGDINSRSIVFPRERRQ